MGITLLTAAEMFNNPRDLRFDIQKDVRGKYRFVIARGPGHNGKPLISTDFVYETREAALEMLREILQGIRTFVMKQVQMPSSEQATPSDPSDQQPSEDEGLTQALVDEILAGLQTNDSFTTARPDDQPVNRMAQTAQVVDRVHEALRRV